MKIIVLFAQRKCAYPGQYAPELLAAIDEYGNFDNPAYMLDEEAKAGADSDIEFWRRMTLVVDEDEFYQQFYGKSLVAKVMG